MANKYKSQLRKTQKQFFLGKTCRMTQPKCYRIAGVLCKNGTNFTFHVKIQEANGRLLKKFAIIKKYILKEIRTFKVKNYTYCNRY